MENHYRDENIDIFRQWVRIKLQNDSRLSVCEDQQSFQITYQNRQAVFMIWPIGIIEESIYEGEKLLFYLHYQFHSYQYATDLFYRMIEKLTENNNHQKRMILLCCTGGMTTSYFAEKMNKYCELNQLNYEIHATAAHRLEEFYKDFEMVLIAPQLRYKVIEFSRLYKPTIIRSIDPVVFATYDCQLLMQQIEEIEKEVEL